MTDIAKDRDSLASTSTEVLEHECVTLAADIAVLTCRWFRVIAELDRRKVWTDGGYKSIAHYVAYRCSLSTSTARDHVRVAHALADLPLITAAFSRGELTYSKVRALVRVATPDGEAELVDMARTASAAQLERIIRMTVAATMDHDRREALRGLFTRTNADAMGEVRAVVRPDELAVIETAIASAEKSVSAETPAPARRADALLRICESYLANGDSCREGSQRTHVVVHVDLNQDAGEITNAETESGIPLHPETASRLSCDSTLFTIVHDKLVPLGHGLAKRNPSRKLRRAIRRRSKGVCEWHGCSEKTYVQLHHIQRWTKDGPTEWWNLAALCWHHHHLVHEGGWSIMFERRTGTMHIWRPDGTELPPDPPRVEAAPYEKRIDDERVVPRWDGWPVQYDACVDAVMHWTNRQPA